jgi:hypothetical protein
VRVSKNLRLGRWSLSCKREGMRPLPQMRETKAMRRNSPALHGWMLAIVLLAMGAWTLGCGGGGAGSVTPPSPPPPSITVSVTPTNGTVLLGETVHFMAVVSNSNDTAVVWSVNGVTGGSTQDGTISADGVYTAPMDLPPGGTVQVTATSQAESSTSATTSVTVTSDIFISLSPSVASVELGAKQSFRAIIQSKGHPDPAIHWSLSGAACPNSCGAVDTSGTYTAPQIQPSASAVSLIATSAADPSKQSMVNVTITSHFTLQLSAPTNLAPGTTSSLVAVLTPVAGSNPNTTLTWSLSGNGCVGSACGILTVTTTQAAGAVPMENTAVYTAPLTAPQPDTVLVTVTPLADPRKQVQANITIQAGNSIGISPAASTVVANGRVTLTASQGGSSSGSFTWNVNGIPGGNTTFGQICAVASSPCQAVTSSSATQVDYVAPGSIPSPNPFPIGVSSTANPSLSAFAEVTIINHVVVSVLPNSVTLPPLGVQNFTVTVLGTTNQNVIWQIQGTGCGTVGSCGAIDSSGNYNAPGIPPSPNNLRVVATSQYDSTQSASANITISTQLNILTLHPTSVYAGGLEGFTLQVDGSGFVPSSPGPGSRLMIGGNARVTNCPSAASCTAPATSADVAQAGSLNIAVQNPNAATSNVVHLVIVAPGTSEDIIPLSSAAPAVTGKDITVVEPTTAGIDTGEENLDLTIAAIGMFSTANNSCTLGGNPIPLLRPSSGTVSADICLFSQAGLDTSMKYTVSGSGDVAVISQQPAGLGIIHLTLQVPASAMPGARTLFIQNTNLDQTSASGVLQVQ